MKKAFVILLLALTACSGKLETQLFSTVDVVLSTPDGQLVRYMTVDESIAGNKFINLNTGIDYAIPTFHDGKTTMKVQKGVYNIAFDGRATLEDGTVRTVRSYTHSDPIKAVNLLQDSETLTLEVIYLF